MQIPSLFPTGTSPLDRDFDHSRAALIAGEETGAVGAALAVERMRAAGWPVRTDSASCTIPLSDSLHQIAPTFTKHVADAFIPDLPLYVETKSGSGLETDSIDAKIQVHVLNFVLFGKGDLPRPASTLAPWVAPHFLLVLVGTKQHSGYVRLAQYFVASVRNGTQPATPDQVERAGRYHFVNIADMTPAYLDRLRHTVRDAQHAGRP